MQDGAGVGGRNTGARVPSVQRDLSASATLPILNGFHQDPANIHRCFLAFLPGSGLRVEFDVTYSKQTPAPFLPGSRIARCQVRSSIANRLSNRELGLLEPRLTHRKQTIAPRYNRELSTNRCLGISHAVIPIPTFLTETASHSEFTVTHSKQTTAPFLTGARTVTKRLVSRTVFNPVSSELFSTHRRISLQDGIAQTRLAPGSPRMHGLVGRP
jgi:hypothetical protein